MNYLIAPPEPQDVAQPIEQALFLIAMLGDDELGIVLSAVLEKISDAEIARRVNLESFIDSHKKGTENG